MLELKIDLYNNALPAISYPSLCDGASTPESHCEYHCSRRLLGFLLVYISPLFKWSHLNSIFDDSPRV